MACLPLMLAIFSIIVRPEREGAGSAKGLMPPDSEKLRVMIEQGKARSKYRLQRQSLPQALAESLRERILNGEFKEGDPLIQEAIAAEYECSRMPVREAFRQLEAAGLIVSKIHKGAIVTTLP